MRLYINPVCAHSPGLPVPTLPGCCTPSRAPSLCLACLWLTCVIALHTPCPSLPLPVTRPSPMLVQTYTDIQQMSVWAKYRATAWLRKKSSTQRWWSRKLCVSLRHRKLFVGLSFVPFAVTPRLQFLRVGVVLLFGATRS